MIEISRRERNKIPRKIRRKNKCFFGFLSEVNNAEENEEMINVRRGSQITTDIPTRYFHNVVKSRKESELWRVIRVGISSIKLFLA